MCDSKTKSIKDHKLININYNKLNYNIKYINIW